MPNPTDSKLVVQPPGLQVDLLKCSRASRHWVLSLGAEVHRLREEVEQLKLERDAYRYAAIDSFGIDAPYPENHADEDIVGDVEAVAAERLRVLLKAAEATKEKKDA